MEQWKVWRAQELAEKIRECPEWDHDMLAELCELADLGEEWEAADGQSFEDVAFKAADILGVEIL